MGLRQWYKDSREARKIKNEIGDLTWDAGNGRYNSSQSAWDLLERIYVLIGKAREHDERTGSERFDTDTMLTQYGNLEYMVGEEVFSREMSGSMQ
jgi:hypothetical protein